MANDINSVSVVGRLTDDSKLSYTTGGVAVSKFYLAVNRSRGSGEQRQEAVSYVEVNYYGKGAEGINQYLTKGRQIGIIGELRQDRWETADGQRRQKLYVIAKSIQLLADVTNQREAAQPAQQNTKPTPKATPRTPPPQPQAGYPATEYGPESFLDDQIPF